MLKGTFRRLFLFSNNLSFSNERSSEEDLPCTAPDECLLGRHLLLAIYPSTGTLKMLEIDKVAVVCALPEFPPGFATPVDTTGEEKKQNNPQNNTAPYTTLIGQMPIRSSSSAMAKSLSLTVNLLQLLSPIWLQTSECGRKNASFLPVEKFVFLSVQGFFFFFLLPFSPHAF